MLYFELSLDSKYATTVRYLLSDIIMEKTISSNSSIRSEKSTEVYSDVSFGEYDSIKFGVHGNIGFRSLTGVDSDGDPLMSFSTPRGGIIVFTLGLNSPVAKIMNMMKVRQVESPGTFNIEIMFCEEKLVSFKKCAFGVQSDTDMCLFSIEFAKIEMITPYSYKKIR